MDASWSQLCYTISDTAKQLDTRMAFDSDKIFCFKPTLGSFRISWAAPKQMKLASRDAPEAASLTSGKPEPLTVDRCTSIYNLKGNRHSSVSVHLKPQQNYQLADGDHGDQNIRKRKKRKVKEAVCWAKGCCAAKATCWKRNKKPQLKYLPWR